MCKMCNTRSTPSPNTIKTLMVGQLAPTHVILAVSAFGDGESIIMQVNDTDVVITHDTALELIGILHDVMDDMDAETTWVPDTEYTINKYPVDETDNLTR